MVRFNFAKLAGPLALVALCGAALPMHAAAADPGAAPAAKTTCIFVNGEKQCVRAGQRCQRRFRNDYLLGGFECRRRRGKQVLVKAGEAALRDGGFVHLQPNGYPSFSTALQAFDKYVANLPGVRQRRGVVGDAEDATMPVLWLKHYEKRLTRTQRAAFRRALSPDADVLPAQVNAQALKFSQFVDQAKARLAAHGMPFNHPIRVLYIKKADVKDALAWIWAGFLEPGDEPTCDINVPPVALTKSDDDMRDIAAHEMTHCAQAEFAQRPDDLVGKSAWVVEGSANWAAAALAVEGGGSAGPGLRGWWNIWIGKPQRDVTTRTYDAMGFFALLEHQGANPWTLIGPMVTANRNGNASAAFNLAAASAGDLIHEWGPSHAGHTAGGFRWYLAGPGLPVLPSLEALVRDGSKVTIPIQRRAGVGIVLDLQADVIQIQPTRGIEGYFRPAGGEDGLLGYSLYCTIPGGCECDGDDIGAEVINPGIALIGYASPPSNGGTTRVLGNSLESFCKQMQTPFGGSQGITLLDLRDPTHGRIIAEFATGSCSVGGSGFRAVAVDPPFRLEATIKSFKKFTTNKGVYEVKYGGGDPAVHDQGAGRPIQQRVPSIGRPPAWRRRHGVRRPRPDVRHRDVPRLQQGRELRGHRRRRDEVHLPAATAPLAAPPPFG